MTSREAREILAIYRPGVDEPGDTSIAAALELARRDPELGKWLEEHQKFQGAFRSKLRQIEVPAQLKATLLAQHKVVRHPRWWESPFTWAAAAAVIFALLLVSLWFKPAPPNRFADYRERVISTAIREYRMDMVTNSMSEFRSFAAAGGAPADYQLTPGLEKLSFTGGGLLRWRSHPVTMVCFDRGDKETLFLFVLKRSQLADPPAEKPQLAVIHDMASVAWSEGDKTYILAGPEEAEFAKKYL